MGLKALRERALWAEEQAGLDVEEHVAPTPTAGVISGVVEADDDDDGHGDSGDGDRDADDDDDDDYYYIIDADDDAAEAPSLRRVQRVLEVQSETYGNGQELKLMSCRSGAECNLP